MVVDNYNSHTKIEGTGLSVWERDGKNAERYNKAVLKRERVSESPGRLVQTECWTPLLEFLIQ